MLPCEEVVVSRFQAGGRKAAEVGQHFGVQALKACNNVGNVDEIRLLHTHS